MTNKPRQVSAGHTYWLGLILLIAALCMPLCAWADSLETSIPQRKPQDSDYNQAVIDLQRNNLSAAEAGFQRSFKKDPKDPYPLLGLAKIALERKQMEEVGNYLQEAVATAPDDSNIQTTWGHYLFFRNRLPAAEAAYKKAIQLSPTAFGPRLELADLYLTAMRRPQDAIAAYQGAAAEGCNTVHLHYMLANAFFETGKTKNAEAEYEKALHLQPESGMLYDALARTYVRENERDKALQLYSAGYEVKPGETSRPSPHLSQAEAYFRVAMAEQSLKRLGAAEQDYHRAAELDPKLAVAYNNFAFLAANQRIDLDEALRFAQKATELDSKVPTFFDTLGWVYLARGQQEQAIATLSKASSLLPHDPEVWYHLGVAYAEAHQTADALRCLHQALRISSVFPEAQEANLQVSRMEAKKK